MYQSTCELSARFISMFMRTALCSYLHCYLRPSLRLHRIVLQVNSSDNINFQHQSLSKLDV